MPKHYVDSPEDPMSEVLSEFLGDVVTLTTKAGRVQSGRLETLDGDTYRLVSVVYGDVTLEVHRDDVKELAA